MPAGPILTALLTGGAFSVGTGGLSLIGEVLSDVLTGRSNAEEAIRRLTEQQGTNESIARERLIASERGVARRGERRGALDFALARLLAGNAGNTALNDALLSATKSPQTILPFINPELGSAEEADGLNVRRAMLAQSIAPDLGGDVEVDADEGALVGEA